MLYQIDNTRLSPRILNPIKYSGLFFKYYFKGNLLQFLPYFFLYFKRVLLFVFRAQALLISTENPHTWDDALDFLPKRVEIEWARFYHLAKTTLQTKFWKRKMSLRLPQRRPSIDLTFPIFVLRSSALHWSPSMSKNVSSNSKKQLTRPWRNHQVTPHATRTLS